MKKETKKSRPEAIEKEIESAKEKASALAIKSALATIKNNNGIISKSEITAISETEAYKYCEIVDKKEVVNAVYKNVVDYLKEFKNLRYIDFDTKMLEASNVPAPTIDDNVICSLALVVAEYKKSLEIAIEKSDYTAQFQALKMIGTLTTALRIRCKDENNVKMWLRKVLSTSEQYSKIADNNITFADLYSKMVYGLSICGIIADLHPTTRSLIITEMIDRYGSKVKEMYDKQYEAYILDKHKRKAS